VTKPLVHVIAKRMPQIKSVTNANPIIGTCLKLIRMAVNPVTAQKLASSSVIQKVANVPVSKTLEAQNVIHAKEITGNWPRRTH